MANAIEQVGLVLSDSLTQIRQLQAKINKVEAAMESGGSYLGVMRGQRVLLAELTSLRQQEVQLRELQMMALRQHSTNAAHVMQAITPQQGAGAAAPQSQQLQPLQPLTPTTSLPLPVLPLPLLPPPVPVRSLATSGLSHNPTLPLMSVADQGGVTSTNMTGAVSVSDSAISSGGVRGSAENVGWGRDGGAVVTTSGDVGGAVLAMETDAGRAKTPSRKMSAKCEREGCRRVAKWGVAGSGVSRFCMIHKEEGMVNDASKRCQEEGCKRFPSFAWSPGDKGLSCGRHKDKDMVYAKKKTNCNFSNCQRHACFGNEGDEKASFCKAHKEKNMNNIVSPRCLHPGCGRLFPTFCMPGERRGTRCSEHKMEGMVDRTNLLCRFPGGCRHKPSYGAPGQKYATRCVSHSEPGMEVKLGGRAICRESGCKRRATHGEPGPNKKPMNCAKHKAAGMLNVVASPCNFPGCTRLPSYGNEEDTPRWTRCANHRVPGMVRKCGRCAEVGCTRIPSFGHPHGRMVYCSSHKLDGMINMRSKTPLPTPPPPGQTTPETGLCDVLNCGVRGTLVITETHGENGPHQVRQWRCPGHRYTGESGMRLLGDRGVGASAGMGGEIGTGTDSGMGAGGRGGIGARAGAGGRSETGESSDVSPGMRDVAVAMAMVAGGVRLSSGGGEVEK